MNKSTHCKYPFREISIKHYDGEQIKTFFPCCRIPNYKDCNKLELANIKNVHELTPQEMFDHPRMQLLRNNLLNGIKDPTCQICWDQEDKGLKSFRQYSDEDFGIDEDGFYVMDIITSNICNLRCRMCTPVLSHQLMIDYQFFQKNNLKDRLDVASKNRFMKSEVYRFSESKQWAWLMENTHKIKVLKASGGEPFYDKNVLSLLRKYIETGAAKNTTLQFHTNATQFTDEIIDLLNQFKKNRHVFSVDGYDKVYEYIRYPAVFKETEKSILNYIENVSNYDPIINFNFVISAHNFLNIDVFVKWVRDIYPKSSITFSEIYPFDRGISLIHVPVSLLKLAKDRARSVLINAFNNEDDKIVDLISQLQWAIDNNKEDKFAVKNEIELFDISRNQSYKDYLDSDLVRWLDE